MRIENPKLLVVIVILIIAAIFVLTPKDNTALVEKETIVKGMTASQKTGTYDLAAELQGISGYINTPQGFKLADVQGKVILVDFWTFSCINCIRTQPFLNAWHEKYADKGLVIVGVHAPEFDFEKELKNVQAAVTKEGINYPVVLDNDFSTWRAYKNRYWPTKYLIDADGFIRYTHIGEGEYAETEEMIQQLLKERDEKLQLEEKVANEITDEIGSQDFTQIGTPELYLGYEFARAPLGNVEGFKPEETVAYTFPAEADAIEPNLVYLEGDWKNSADYMELVSETGKVLLYYKAKALNIVAGNPAAAIIYLDGNPLPPTHYGDAVALENNTPVARINEKTLYNLVSAPDYDPHLIEFEVQGKGFQLYTFTFG